MSPERYLRINQMLDKRQPDLTVIIENVHKNHNLSAVVRSADAVGVHEMHAVWLTKKGAIVRWYSAWQSELGENS